MTTQIIENRLGGEQHFVPMMVAGVLALERNAFEDFFLTLFAKPIQLGHLARFTRRFQRLNGFNTELVVERLDLLGAHALNIQHLDQPSRDGGFEVGIVLQFAGWRVPFPDVPFDGEAVPVFFGQRQSTAWA